VPHIHSYISLYPLNPTPPSQPSPLPALPTLLEPNAVNKHSPTLITLYPSSSVLVQPNSFANQVLTANHQLLAKNLHVANSVKVVSVYLGNIQLPSTASMLLSTSARSPNKPSFLDAFRQSTGLNKLYTVKDYFLNNVLRGFSMVVGHIGLGTSAQNYAIFERNFLRLLKTHKRKSHAFGQYSLFPLLLSKYLPLPILNTILPHLPALPPSSGPGQYTPTIRTAKEGTSHVHVETLNEKNTSASRSTQSKSSASSRSSSDIGEEGEEDGLFGSVHTSSGDSGSNEGLSGSWIGL
jgi:hypothetical protein